MRNAKTNLLDCTRGKQAKARIGDYKMPLERLLWGDS